MIKVTKIIDKYGYEQNKYTMYNEVGDIVTWCEDENMEMKINIISNENIDKIEKEGEDIKYMDGYMAALEMMQKCVNKKIHKDEYICIEGCEDIDEAIKIINDLIQQMRY